MVIKKRKARKKRGKMREWRRVYLTLTGKNLDPDKITEALRIMPEGSGKRGELRGKRRKTNQGFWVLESGPGTWRLETQMKAMLKRIAPVKRKLARLIRENSTVQEAYLELAFAPPRGVANACYCFDAELIDEFTSMGLDIALSIQIIGEWEKIFKAVGRKKRLSPKANMGVAATGETQ